VIIQYLSFNKKKSSFLNLNLSANKRYLTGLQKLYQV